MSATADPTIELLDRLDDESQWDVKHAVPIFCPHEREGKDGKPIKVDVARLKKIIANVKRLRNRAVVPRITIGHIKQNPDTPEQDQPDIVGYADNWRLGEFGPENTPCILVDRYYEKSCHTELYHPDGRQIYPYRSAEFYPASDEITGVAILKRDPQLDMGLTYERAPGGGSYFYVMGDDMPMAPPMAPPAAPPAGPPGGAALPAPAMDAEFMKFKEMFERYIREHPVLGKLCNEKPGMEEGGGEGGGDEPPAGPPPTEPPAAKKPEDKMGEEYRRHQQPLIEQLRETKERLAKIEADNRSKAEAYSRSESKRLVGKLVSQGFLIPDPEKEVKRMTAMNDADRNSRYDEIFENYNRAPTGGEFLDIAPTSPDGETPKGPDPSELTARDLDDANEYMRKNQKANLDHETMWEKAQEYAIAQRGKRRR